MKSKLQANSRIDTVTRERAEEVGVAVLVWLGADEELMGRFLALSGLTVLSLRDASKDLGFLEGVIDFVMGHEPTLMSFCQATGTRPEIVVASQHALGGGAGEHWT